MAEIDYNNPPVACRCDDSNLICIDSPESISDSFRSNNYSMSIVLTHAITFIVGVIGNSVVIGTWARGGKIRSPTTTFLVSLACADLLLLIIFMPLETAQYFVITWDKHGYICKLSSFVEILSGMASILNLVAVSVERYLVIVYPIQARRWCTVTKSRRSLLFVWILAIILAAPSFFKKSTQPITYTNNTCATEITAYYCFEHSGTWAVLFAIYELMLLFVIPATLLMLCYSRVIRELWTSTRVISVLTSNSTVTAPNSSQRPVQKSYLVRWQQNHAGQKSQAHQANAAAVVKSQQRAISISVKYHEATEMSSPSPGASSCSTKEIRKCAHVNGNSLSQPCLAQSFTTPSIVYNGIAEEELPDSSMSNGTYQYSSKALPKMFKLNKEKTKLATHESEDLEPVEKKSESSVTSLENPVGYYRERSNSLNTLLKTLFRIYRCIQCCLCCLICCCCGSRKEIPKSVVLEGRSPNVVQHPISLASTNTATSNLQSRHLMPPTPSSISHLTVRSVSTSNTYQHSISSSGFKASVTDVRHARKQLYCQVIKMLLLIVILFLICWGPRLVFNVIKSAGFEEFSENAYSARVFFYLLPFIHSALNPFVYGFMSTNFRVLFFRRLNHRHRNKRRKPEVEPINQPANVSAVHSFNDKQQPERCHSVNEYPDCSNNTNNNSVGNDAATTKNVHLPSPTLTRKVSKPDSSSSSLREIENELEQAVQVDRAQHHARKQFKPKRTESVQSRTTKRPFLHKYLRHQRSTSLFQFPNRKTATVMSDCQQKNSNANTNNLSSPSTKNEYNVKQCVDSDADHEHTAHSF